MAAPAPLGFSIFLNIFRSAGRKAIAITGATTAANTAHTTSACHSQLHSAFVVSHGCAFTARNSAIGASGKPGVPNSKDPSFTNTGNSSSSSGYIAWLLNWLATTFSLNTPASAKASTVVDPSNGFTPTTRPSAKDHDKRSGVAP